VLLLVVGDDFRRLKSQAMAAAIETLPTTTTANVRLLNCRVIDDDDEESGMTRRNPSG
jgi:hypothetical protein